MATPDKKNKPSDPLKEQSDENQPRGDAKRRTRRITAKDVGWITPTAFVAPITMVPIDPPRPLNRRNPKGE